MSSDWYVPTWDPYSNLGQYVFSDPERYFYLLAAPVIALPGLENFNLTFNFLLIISACATASMTYLVFRSLGLVASLAALAAVTFVNSDIIYTHLSSGRLNTMTNMFFMFFSIVCFIRWKATHRGMYLAMLILGLGVIMVLSAYYILVPAFMLFVMSFAEFRRRGLAWMPAILKAGAEIFVISSAGLIVFVPILAPLVLHNMTIAAQGYDRLISLPDLSTLFNLFLPITEDQKEVRSQVSFPHLSIFLIVGLSMLRPRMLRRANASFLGIAFCSAIFLGVSVGFFLPRELFREYYEKIPIISQLRHSFIFVSYASFGLIALATLGLQERFWKNWEKPALVKTGLVLLVIVVQCGFYQRDFTSYRLTNEPDYPVTSGMSQKLAMQRTYCFPPLYCPPRGVPEARGILGFSNNFLEQQKIALFLLTGRTMDVARPHWIGRNNCSNLRSPGIELTALRYAVCRKSDVPPDPFKAVWTSANERVITYEHPSSLQALPRAFTDWTVGAVSSGDVKPAANAWADDKVLLEQDPGLLPSEIEDPLVYSIDRLRLTGPVANYNVTVNKSAIVVFSELDADGWTAAVNGAPAQILRAFGSFRALSLPPGTHTVEFYHTDPYLSLGLRIWIFGFPVVLLGFIGVMLTNRRSHMMQK
ncbi:hypothetical protein [Roseobacter sp.]|uniref:hypothetical protein n=1 Tax=Roseobacter sp. TaxID=1907202 RepID=UPI00385B618F